MKKKQHRLTVGCRARFLTIEEKPLDRKNGFVNEGHWREEYGGREVLIKERSSSGGFSVMLIGEGVKKLRKRDPRTIENEMAWVDEEDLILVDTNFDNNLDFIDWYEEHEEDFCPDCGAWFPDVGRMGAICPNKECPGHEFD